MSRINEKIFKAYDIRGIYPRELDEETACYIGQAFAEYIKEGKVAVGRDVRLSSESLHKAFIEGILSQGLEVMDIGVVPSEAVYFSVGKFGLNGGAMITASHNPKEYNGVRIVNEKVEMIPGRKLLEFMGKNEFSPKDKKGKIRKKNIILPFVQHVLSVIDIGEIKSLKVVIDAGNGTAGIVIPELFKNLPCEYVPLYFEPDGNFPNRPPNPLLTEGQGAIRKKVIEEKADLGVMFDGDSDRIFLINEKGEFVRGDISLLLMAKYFLEKDPGTSISFNVICSRVVPEKIKEWGGKPLRTPVGYVNVSKPVKEAGGAMGGEASAHYCFRDNYYADSGMMALLTLLVIISKSGQKLSKITSELNQYSRKEEYFELKNAKKVLADLKTKYSDGKQDELDGLTVQYEEWWFNARPSNTEPLLRLTIESRHEELLKEKLKELINLIK